MRIARFIGSAALPAIGVALVLTLGVHLRGASLSRGAGAEDPMIPKIEAIFAPWSDAESPGLAVVDDFSCAACSDDGVLTGLGGVLSCAKLNPANSKAAKRDTTVFGITESS